MEQVTLNKSVLNHQTQENSQQFELGQTGNPQSTFDDPDIAISVRNISKRYQLYETPIHRLKEAIHPFKKKYHREFWALKNISFDVPRGTTFGIIGRNGSGKSTLLQIINGILMPTTGIVRVKGRISALLELGSGFNRDLTGSENIFMQGAIMGIARKEMAKRFDRITEFAEIGDFIDQPVKTYSSGMYIRLAFACAINVDPEILIIDEALAVGDAKFQRKCYAKLEGFREKGRTVLFVSHSTGTINQICDSAMLLDKGQIVDIGVPKHITMLYDKMLFGEEVKPVQKAGSEQKGNEKMEPQKNELITINLETIIDRSVIKRLAIQKLKENNGTKKAEFLDFGFIDKDGEKSQVLETGKNYVLFSQILFYEELDDVFIGFYIKNVKGIMLGGTNTDYHKISVLPQRRGDILESLVHFTMWLAPGDYFQSFNVRSSNYLRYDHRVDAIHFRVVGDCKCGGFVNLAPKLLVKNINLYNDI